MTPDLQLINGNRSAEIYNRGMQYAIEYYENGLWKMVRTARDLNEAKLMAESFIGPSTPTLLNE